MRIKTRSAAAAILAAVALTAFAGCGGREAAGVPPTVPPTTLPMTAPQSTAPPATSETTAAQTEGKLTIGGYDVRQFEHWAYLGFDLLPYIIVYSDGYTDQQPDGYYISLNIDFIRCNITEPDINYYDDMLVVINSSDGWREHTAYLFYLPEQGEYSVHYNLTDDLGAPHGTYRLIDLNDDHIAEFMYTATYFGQRTETFAYICTMVDGVWQEIFDVGITQIFGDKSFYYENEILFAEGGGEWYDIRVDSVLFDNDFGGPNESSKEVGRGSTVYVFSGGVYRPDGDEYVYWKSPLDD